MERSWKKVRQARWERIQKIGIVTGRLSEVERDLGPPYHFPDALKKLGPGEVNRPLPWRELTEEQQEFQATKMAIHAAMIDRMDQAIGRVLVSKAWNSQKRSSIGKAKPSAPPAHLDFETWLGPAPKVPYQPNMLHGIWRWWQAFGTGDMGNDGVHDLDIARWGLGVTTHPDRIVALGGKYFFDDDQQFPDTQNVLFEYGPGGATGKPHQLIFEQRIWAPYIEQGYENGNAFYGTDGLMLLGKHGGWKLYGPRNKLREQMGGSPDLRSHHDDFFPPHPRGRHAECRH